MENNTFDNIILINIPTIKTNKNNMKAEIQNKIDELKAQISALEIELNKPEPWNPKSGGEWIMNSDGSIERLPYPVKYTDFGVSRFSPKQAQEMRDEIRAFARLLAYRDEFDLCSTPAQRHWYVTRSINGTWLSYETSYNHPNAGRVFFSSDSVVNDLVDKLNSGEVKL